MWSLALSDDARLVVVVQLEATPRAAAPGLAARSYERLDRALFGGSRSPLTPTNASDLLTGVPRVAARCTPRADGRGFDLDSEALRALRGHALDGLLDLSGAALGGDARSAARLGLWRFAHDDAARNGQFPFHDALLDRSGVVEVRLVADTPAVRRVLQRSYSSGNPHSLALTRKAALWKAADLPARAWRAFAAGETPPFDGQDAATSDTTSSRAPSAFAIGRHALGSAAQVARNRARLLRRERVWFVALRRRGTAPLESDPLAGFRPLSCPIDRFHADPVLVHDGRAHHLFFEDADRATERGAISWRAIDADGNAGPIRRILEADAHLSYPFVFAWRGDWYMIPETSMKRSVELYRAVEFPLRWELEKVLFDDVAAVDSTVVEHGGRLWLFTAMNASGGSLNDELCLFHADEPGGPWIPHPQNPIVSDVRRARPAGPVFRDGDRLYRPGQDCAGDYGAAFWIHRIDALDERHYRETPIRRVAPSWHPGGLCTHTYTRAGDFEAMDNRVWMPRLGRANRSAEASREIE